MQAWLAVVTGEFPRGHVQELVVVAERLALGRLELFPEVAAARLVAVQGVDAGELGQIEEVSVIGLMMMCLVIVFRWVQLVVIKRRISTL